MDVSVTFPAVHVVVAAHIVLNNWSIEATEIEGALMGAARAWSRCHDDELVVPWLIAAWSVSPEAARVAAKAGVIITDARGLNDLILRFGLPTRGLLEKTRWEDSEPTVRAPGEISTGHLMLRRSVDGRDKPALESHVLGDGELGMFYGRDTFSPAGFDDGCECPDADDLILGRFSFEGDPERTVSYTIFPSEGQWIIGFIRLVPRLDVLGGADISFYIFKEHRRRIYAEEAMGAVIDAYFSGNVAHPFGMSISTIVSNGDIWALDLAARLGFMGPGIDPETHLVLGGWEETVTPGECSAMSYKYTLAVADFYKRRSWK